MLRPFEKYNSLTLIRENHEDELQKYIDLTQGQRFVVTEKIHGANFEVATDGQTVRYASRNQVLGEGADFYGYRFVAQFLTPKILAMFKDMKELIMEQHKACDYIEAKGDQANRPDIPRDFQEITIRGELAGGQYPNAPKVKEGNGQVGKGKIWYSQQKSFFAFEICVDGVPQDFYTLGTMCGSYGIPVAPVLTFGTFEECLEFSREHLEDITTVPNMTPLLNENGHPILNEDSSYCALHPIHNNTREGHVISSVNPVYLPNGKRMVFKHKGVKFMENKGEKKPKAKVEVILTPEQQVVFDTILPMITVARMEAVMSKEGTWEPKDFTKLCGKVLEDATDEAHGDAPNAFFAAWAHISTKERKVVMKQLGREAAERLRTAYFS
ncbi:RNA ligase 2 [Vibrio phage CHOED]|uniref:RNA ligase 2 n=1 Tax=Vibrio phage CHOED TaxID=1458716 RepID=UPI00042EA3C3|nr:RNA ligase 2 [Vibrio phage CHOED]AHK11905.1 RNA ligase 2 [Vibrio phage CHOED]